MITLKIHLRTSQLCFFALIFFICAASAQENPSKYLTDLIGEKYKEVTERGHDFGIFFEKMVEMCISIDQKYKDQDVHKEKVKACFDTYYEKFISENPYVWPPIGEIRMSILSPNEFNRYYGSGWVLLAGQELKDDWPIKAFLPGEKKLPDARGVFLRGMNHSGGLDPDGRGVGSLQDDAMKRHSHYIFRNEKAEKGNYGTVTETNHAVVAEYFNNQAAGDSKNYDIKGTSGSPNIALSSRSGSEGENRPKNISVYIYIRVK